MQDEFTDIMNHLTENARFALQKADYFSKKYNNGYMGTEHLLLGILAQDTSTASKLLFEDDITLDKVEKALNKPADDIASNSQMAMMSLSEATVLTLQMAKNFTREQGIDSIGTEHLLYALINQPNSRASIILADFDVDIEKLAERIEELAEKQAEEIKNKKEKL